MRPDYCPLWNEPCQKGCDPKCGTMNAWEVLRKENERLRARVASLEESLHYANGVADLAIKHRDVAEHWVAKLSAELRASDCPYPVCAAEDESIGACVDSGSCGCRHGEALAKDGA